ncbi:putative bifunctional diguanylate cyclase/phosphodiesterase [Methylobacterium planeticum]|uniref:EAL domain-containing protein n=1 Tax=Methylobacterium planeticum TaxID=2615211 RepID=A0A6N6MRB5_9HYPH|nr:EAL domain-containing protein [Methylobacterium planeticum]KAB1074285.1 EAL domain-containing protein [Methylobacterium planeticum]
MRAAQPGVSPDPMYRLLVQGVRDYAIYMLDPDGVVTNWNAGAERAKGYRAEEIVGRTFACFYGPAERAAGAPERNLAVARREGRFEDEGWRLRKDGSQFWAHVVIDAIHDEDGCLVGFAKITRDRTEQRAAAERLRETSENLNLALSHMSQGLYLLDAQGRLVLCNDRFREILGLGEDETARGTAFPGLLRRVLARSRALRGPAGRGMRRTRRSPVMTAVFGSDVAEIALGEQILLIATRGLPTGGTVSTIEDVTERRRIENRIFHLAHHDSLTGLANRAAFNAYLDNLLAETGAATVLSLDLDRFKAVNDTFGHPAGDVLLNAVAERLRDSLREVDLVARLGGDEFVVVLADPGPEPERAARAVAERIIAMVGRPVDLDGQSAQIGVSIGIAIAPRDGRDAGTLFRHADIALYRAKAAGRNTHCFYEAGMSALLASRNRLELDLRQAVSAGEFQLQYQPALDLGRRTVSGCEALVRWVHPRRGLIGPGEFIPLAEETGLIVPLGAWILHEACREAAAWPDALRVAVNVSAVQFERPGLEHNVAAALAVSGLAPNRLELEITESVLMRDSEAVIACLHRLRALGVRIALDDFGTGYSSLGYLRRFPFDRIKIDRSFISEIDARETAAIVRAIVSLGGDLGARITAEGVETPDQLNFVHRMGCQEMQGYLLSCPLPVPELRCFLARTPALERAA